MINDEGGINGRKINFISLDDGYSPPKTVEMVRKLVEQDEVLFAVPDARHAVQHRDPQVHERARRCRSCFVATGATKWNDPKNYPVDDGLAAELPDRGPDLRASTS